MYVYIRGDVLIKEVAFHPEIFFLFLAEESFLVKHATFQYIPLHF